MNPNLGKPYRYKQIPNDDNGINYIEIMPRSKEAQIIILTEMMRQYFRDHDVKLKQLKKKRSRKKNKNHLTDYLDFPKLEISYKDLIHFKIERRKKSEKNKNFNFNDSDIIALRILS